MIANRQSVSLIAAEDLEGIDAVRQVAPLLRKFCKVSAHFTIARQRSHALAMLRSFKVILSFSTHATWPTRTCSQAPARQQYHQFPKGARSRQCPWPGIF